MKYRQFGSTGMLVSEICLGTMTFGGRGMYEAVGQVDQAAADRLVGQALDAGVNFFDTANVYSEGQAELLLGKAIRSRRPEVVLATKVQGRMQSGPNGVGLSRIHIIQEVEASLRRLGTDYIDLYQVHGVDNVTPLEETLRALEDLVRTGKVRYVGCSNMSAWQIMKALGISRGHGWVSFESLQAYYSLIGRDIEREIVPLVQDQGLGLMVWSPLAGGLLTDKFYGPRGGHPAGGVVQAGPVDADPKHPGPEAARRSKVDFPPVNPNRVQPVLEALHGVAGERGAPMAQVALAWLLQQPVVTSVVVGAKREEQLAENLAASGLQLSAPELRRLEEASALPQEYPGWMISIQARERFPDDG